MGTHPIFESDFDCLTEWKMSSSKLVLKSTTTTSLNDRFSKLMKNRPDESSRTMVDKSGRIRPGSEKNRRFAEELEKRSGDRRSGVAQEVRRKPLSTRLGDIGQGGARGFKQAIKRTPTKGGLAGRVGKRNENTNMANKALKRAQDMLRNTERELAILKRNKAAQTRVNLQKNQPKRGGGATRGAPRGRGRGGSRGGGRGGRGGRGGGRGGDRNVSEDTLDKQLDSYMLKTKGGLDAQMDEYMSKTKGGLDKQMEEYMAQKSK